MLGGGVDFWLDRALTPGVLPWFVLDCEIYGATLWTSSFYTKGRNIGWNQNHLSRLYHYDKFSVWETFLDPKNGLNYRGKFWETMKVMLSEIWTLGGHTTFRILFFLRYVVDIGKSSPNPKFFWNPMKTDRRDASQSSKFGLFWCFCTTSWKIVKIITYMENADVFVVET